MTSLVKDEPTLFDYAAVPESDRDWLREQEDALESQCREVVARVIRIGLILEDVFHRVPRHFNKWLRDRTSFSRTKAHDYRSIAAQFGPLLESICSPGEHLPFEVKALTELSASTVKPAARIEAVERAQKGETITRDVAKEIIDRNKPARRAAQPTIFHECETPPPVPTTADARTIAELQRLARDKPVTLDTQTDADDPDDIRYTVYVIGLPLASGRTLTEAVDNLTGHVEKKACTWCGALLPRTADYFTVKTSHKDGLASECKACSRSRVNAAKQERVA